MNKKTDFKDKKQFQKTIKCILEDLSKDFLKSEIVLSEELSSIKSDSIHFINKILSNRTKNNRCEKLITRQILQSVYQSEMLSAGSGVIALLFSLELSKNLNKFPLENVNENYTLSVYDKYLNKFKQNLINNSKQAFKNDIRNIIKQCCNNDIVLSNVIWNAIKFGGLESKIFVEEGLQDNYLIEVKEGYSFNLNPFKFMLPNNFWDRNECKILIVDGLIEKISELDHLLNKCYETNQSLLIVALGFSEEVVATLKTNMDRNTLDVQPVRIPTDLNSLNVANDIAVISDCLPVSSMKGDLLSLVKWEDLPTVDKIILSNKETVIENSKTKHAALSQIKSLLQKRQENYLYEDIQNILDKRIKSLSSNSINIFLPNLSQIEKKTKQIQIDTSLRNCKTIINYGITDFYQSVKELNYENDLEKIIFDSLNSIKFKDKYVPTLSAIYGCMLSGKNIIQLYTAAGIVEIIS